METRALRIGHSGDWHVTSGPRLPDTTTSLEFIVGDGASRGVDLWTVGGDLTGTDVPHESRPGERNVVDRILQDMARTAPVLVLEGNHESPGDLEGYGRLDGFWPIVVATSPTIFHLERCPAISPVGLLEAVGVSAADHVRARVYALPFPHRRWWSIDAGAPLHEQRAQMIAALRALLDAWRLDIAAAQALGIPTVFLFHGNIGGSITGGNEVIEGGMQRPGKPVRVQIGREVELSPHDLDELGADICLLAHIHKAQRIGLRGVYPGAPAAQNYGEPDAKAYMYAEVWPGQAPHISFVPTPARRLITIEAEWRPGGAVDGDIAFPARHVGQGGVWLHRGDCDDDLVAAIAGAEVRLRWQVAAEYREACPAEEFAEWIRAQGAVLVRAEPTVIPHQRTRLDGVTIERAVAPAPDGDATEAGAPAVERVSAAQAWSAAETPAELLAIYWQTTGDAPTPDDQAGAIELLESIDHEVTHAA